MGHPRVHGRFLARVIVKHPFFAEVTLFRRNLRDHCPIADHGFHEVVGHGQPRIGPVEQAAVQSPNQPRHQHQPETKKNGVCHRSRAREQDQQTANTLSDVREQRDATCACQCIDGVSVEDDAKQAADAPRPNRVRG